MRNTFGRQDDPESVLHRFGSPGPSASRHSSSTTPTAFYRADQDGSLGAFLKPDLTPPERAEGAGRGMDIGGGVTQRTKGDVPITADAEIGVSFLCVLKTPSGIVER
jgi:hypothetical protein